MFQAPVLAPNPLFQRTMLCCSCSFTLLLLSFSSPSSSSSFCCMLKMTVTASVESKIQEISFTEEELEAAEILMQFSDSKFMLRWGTKKKRTRVIWSTFINNRLKTDVESPVTPPSFSTSDTDSKSKQLRITRVFKKKALKETVCELLNIQQQLKHDISRVRDYYEKLKAENLQLKSRQLELGLYQRREEFDLKSCKDTDFFEEPKEDFNPAFEEKQASIIIQSPIIHQPCVRSADQEQLAPIVHHPYEPLVVYPRSHDINPLNDEATKRDFTSQPLLLRQGREDFS